MPDTDVVMQSLNISRLSMLSCNLHTKAYLCLSKSDENFRPSHHTWNHLPHSGKSQPIQGVVDGGLKVAMTWAIVVFYGFVGSLGLISACAEDAERSVRECAQFLKAQLFLNPVKNKIKLSVHSLLKMYS